MVDADDLPDGDLEHLPPGWFDALIVGAALLGASTGVTGLALAMVDRYHTALTLSIAVPVTAILIAAFLRSMPRRTTSRASNAGALLAIVLAGAFFVAAARTPSQDVIIHRDPASYSATARELGRSGSLDHDARGTAFADVPGLQFSSAAVYDVGEPPEVEGPLGAVSESGDIQFQFSHLTSVLLSAAHDIGGYRMMFRLPAAAVALALLAVYAVTARATRAPLVSLAAPLVLAGSLPFVYVARNTYSEGATAAFLWSSVLVLAIVHHRPTRIAGAIGGILVGAIVCSRIDAIMYLAMVPPVAVWSVMGGGPGRLRRRRAGAWAAALLAAAAVTVIGWVDLSAHSGDYVRDLGPELRLLRAGLAASVMASALLAAGWLGFERSNRFDAGRALIDRSRRLAAPIIAGAVSIVLLAGWLVRPHVQVATGDPLPITGAIQSMMGEAVRPDRRYGEDSLRWMAWYLGPVTLLLAIFGIFRSGSGLGRRIAPLHAGLLLLVLGGAGLYWWNPQITPDHLWATRRFVPVAFPGLAVFAAIGAAAVVRPFADRAHDSAGGPWARRAAAGIATILALCMLVPALSTTRPVRHHQIGRGFLRPVLDLCEALPERPAIVFVGSSGQSAAQTVRSWCGVPVARQGSALADGDLDRLRRAVGDNGYELVLVAFEAEPLDSHAASMPGARVGVTSTAIDDRAAEWTLDAPPRRYETHFGTKELRFFYLRFE